MNKIRKAEMNLFKLILTILFWIAVYFMSYWIINSFSEWLFYDLNNQKNTKNVEKVLWKVKYWCIVTDYQNNTYEWNKLFQKIKLISNKYFSIPKEIYKIEWELCYLKIKNIKNNIISFKWNNVNFWDYLNKKYKLNDTKMENKISLNKCYFVWLKE